MNFSGIFKTLSVAIDTVAVALAVADRRRRGTPKRVRHEVVNSPLLQDLDFLKPLSCKAIF